MCRFRVWSLDEAGCRVSVFIRKYKVFNRAFLPPYAPPLRALLGSTCVFIVDMLKKTEFSTPDR